MLLPLSVFSQERQIGIKTDTSYEFNWNMETVVQETFHDLGADFIVDTVYAENDSMVQVRFHDDNYVYGDLFRIKRVKDSLYTDIAAGCLNTCYGYECGSCAKNSVCACVCVNTGICNSKDLAVFKDEPLSKWIAIRILTNQNPEQ